MRTERQGELDEAEELYLASLRLDVKHSVLVRYTSLLRELKETDAATSFEAHARAMQGATATGGRTSKRDNNRVH